MEGPHPSLHEQGGRLVTKKKKAGDKKPTVEEHIEESAEVAALRREIRRLQRPSERLLHPVQPFLDRLVDLTSTLVAPCGTDAVHQADLHDVIRVTQEVQLAIFPAGVN